MTPNRMEPMASGPGRWPKMETDERNKVYKNTKEQLAHALKKEPRKALKQAVHTEIASRSKSYNYGPEKVTALGKSPVSQAMLNAFKQEKSLGKHSAKDVMFYSLDYLQNAPENNETMQNIDLVEKDDSVQICLHETRWQLRVIGSDGTVKQCGYLFPSVGEEDDDDVPVVPENPEPKVEPKPVEPAKPTVEPAKPVPPEPKPEPAKPTVEPMKPVPPEPSVPTPERPAGPTPPEPPADRPANHFEKTTLNTLRNHELVKKGKITIKGAVVRYISPTSLEYPVQIGTNEAQKNKVFIKVAATVNGKKDWRYVPIKLDDPIDSAPDAVQHRVDKALAEMRGQPLPVEPTRTSTAGQSEGRSNTKKIDDEMNDIDANLDADVLGNKLGTEGKNLNDDPRFKGAIKKLLKIAQGSHKEVFLKIGNSYQFQLSPFKSFKVQLIPNNEAEFNVIFQERVKGKFSMEKVPVNFADSTEDMKRKVKHAYAGFMLTGNL